MIHKYMTTIIQEAKITQFAFNFSYSFIMYIDVYSSHAWQVYRGVVKSFESIVFFCTVISLVQLCKRCSPHDKRPNQAKGQKGNRGTVRCFASHTDRNQSETSESFLIPQSHADVSLKARHHKQTERKDDKTGRTDNILPPLACGICSPPLDFTPSQVWCTMSWSAKGNQSKGWEVWSGGGWCCSMHCPDHKDKWRGYHRDSRQIEYSSFLPFHVLW